MMRACFKFAGPAIIAAGLAMPALAAEADPRSAEEIRNLARDAYLYAYPIVSMDLTMRQATNVPDAKSKPLKAPLNQFANVRAYPGADVKVVVRPNFDTLYSSAWIDVTSQPVVLSVPDTGGRYYLLEMLDMWTDVFAVVGSRTTGTKAGNFALVGSDWNGTLPEGIEKIVTPTPRFWIIGRTQTNGPADYEFVHRIQDGYKLTPLDRWGQDYIPPGNQPVDVASDDATPPQTQVNRLDGIGMLSRLAELFSKYPPHANDYPMLFRLRALGLEPGKPFNPAALDPETVKTINQVAGETLADMPAAMRKIGQVVNGWSVATQFIGTYGTSYKQRAVIALGGLGANLPEDAVYPTAFADEDGRPLISTENYVIHFDKGQLPPADAFWSITMYDKDGFQVPNPINRFALGDRDKLTFNEDGSLDIYMQAESPGKDKESNWLPAPKDAPFQPTMRIYSPRNEVADGRWAPPPIRKAGKSFNFGSAQ
ncbi:MAG: DUF1254 domain-containing protein [Rhodomicrobiaceae bacterium]